jgi:hypothetical protein
MLSRTGYALIEIKRAERVEPRSSEQAGPDDPGKANPVTPVTFPVQIAQIS